jgi:hypothetical protein
MDGTIRWNASVASPPVSAGISERLDDVEELHDRAGPAVRDDQRQRPRLGGAQVQEVDVGAVDRRGELRNPVKPSLVLAPVVVGVPVVGQLSEIAYRDAPGPRHVRYLPGPAGVAQPQPQIGKVGVGDIDPERP